MLTVPIKLIRPSPNPIRKTWDEDKMQELAASIKERGVIVPIKVRPVEGVEPCRIHGWYGVDGEGGAYDRSTGYTCEGCCGMVALNDEGEEAATWEIVYGHRRAEASRRAGLKEIPAIVDGIDDTGTLIQALIENVQRENMNPVDEARAMRDILDITGWGVNQLARHLGLQHPFVSNRLALLNETPATLEMIGRAPLGRKGDIDDIAIGEWHIRAIRGSGIQEAKDRELIATKAAATQLTAAETRAVADAYKAADTPELKDAVLNTSGKLGDPDRILQVAQMKVGVEGIAREREYLKQRAVEEWDHSVKEFLDMFKLFDRSISRTITAAEYDKFSPEAKAFTVRKIDGLIANLTSLREVLSNE